MLLLKKSKTLPHTCLAILLGLLLMELVLTVGTWIFPQLNSLIFPSEVVPDADLEYRFVSDSPGLSSSPNLRRSPELLALGDSITYGSGVSPREAWPEILSSFFEDPLIAVQRVPEFYSGKVNLVSECERPSSDSAPDFSHEVVNVSCPGYGPVHYLLLSDQAIERKPRVMIATFYTGNDLFDSFHLVDFHYFSGQTKRPPTQCTLEESMEFLHMVPRVTRQARANFENAVVPANRAGLKLVALIRAMYAMSEYAFLDTPDSGLIGNGLRCFINFLCSFSNDAFFFDDGTNCTVFSTKRVFSGLDMQNDWIKRGLAFSLDAFRLMKSKAESQGIRFCVLVIPTKHTVFKGAVTKYSANLEKIVPQAYSAIVENESNVRERAFDYFRKNGIAYIDTLPYLREAVTSGKQPYKITPDNHPNVEGHKVIARCIRDKLLLHPLALSFKR
ncbi:hypothetical protein [Desulfomonile tiedjei]|uniref:SGNH hydrolase-type esterase domain-containing protein n=1 Tax=Desulfomonile tiedjei (strain ATCC 49306 / DSM 6799 / DCB-1) TaxID=706587 RepID=I4C3X9_DESTA|nr:hypothetical protein [Desulfomonile tiedjei]AFM24270.1 hypothetical protein Desti_1559 [Desulfomonile tiedjei DSM 6799]